MNLLYLSVHGTLEFNELTIFNQLGFNVKSLGYLTDPHNPTSIYINPIMQLNRDEDFIKQANFFIKGNPCNPYRLTKEFLKPFDVIIVMHSLELIQHNWDLFKDKLVIRRTISQGNGYYESQFKPYVSQGLKVVRFSKNEITIPGVCGFDKVIRCCADENVYNNWTGDLNEVLVIKNRIAKYPIHTQYEAVKQVLSKFNHRIIGAETQNIPSAVSDISFNQLLDYLKHYRVSFCPPSRPGSITYSFVESWLNGTPVIAFGPGLGHPPHTLEGKTYEIHELIDNGVNGFYSDNINEIQSYIKELFENYSLAKSVGKAGREKALKTFSYKVISEDWREFFKSQGINL